MNWKNIFKTKSRSKSVYPSLSKMNSNTATYTTANYKGIAKEGYISNWIIFRCVQEIIKAAVQLEFKVREQTGEEVRDVPNHPVTKLITKPNKIYGKNEFIKRAIAFYYLGGEAPLHKISTSSGIKELYVYRPDRIKFKATGDVDHPYSDIKYGEEKDIDERDFSIWKNFNPLDDLDGLGHGMPFLEPILRNGDLLNEMLKWNTALLQNGGSPTGVLLTDPQFSGEDSFDRMEEKLRTRHQGGENAGKFLLLDGISQYIATGVSPREMDWIRGKDSIMRDICIGIGVDPILIGFNESASYNNKKEAEKGLYTKVVIPMMQELSEVLGEFLGLEENEVLEVEYGHIPVMQEDMNELYDKINKASGLTINEKRIKLGEEPVKGGDIIAPSGSYAIVEGQVYLPMNLINISEKTVEKSFIY